MPGELKSVHLDDFTLLRYTVGDLDDVERRGADRHLEACRVCAEALKKMSELDAELKLLAKDGALQPELSHDDPFYTRPQLSGRRASASDPGADARIEAALAASDRAFARSQQILYAIRSSPESLMALLADLPLSEATDRFALLYALQEAGRQIAESPVRFLAFAEKTLIRLEERPPRAGSSQGDTELAIPLSALVGHAHLLAGQAFNWTGELEKARHHFEAAYRAFGQEACDEASFALVEYHESQRRSFAGKGSEALLLARRAAASFESMGLEDYFARARGAEGLALSTLGQEEEALATFRSAPPVFEKRELWSNYVGAVNNVAECLSRLGRLDEARREYARALRRVSRRQHPALVAIICDGLAEILFSAKRYREAAMSFARAVRLYQDTGLVANRLKASLLEIESWALSGDLSRAWHRFQIFQTDVARHAALDPSIVLELERALSGERPDLTKVAELRRSAGELLRGRLKTVSG